MVEFVTKREVARKPNHRERNLRRELEWITARYDCGAMSDAVFGHAKRLETDLSLDPASGAAVSVDWKQAARLMLGTRHRGVRPPSDITRIGRPHRAYRQTTS